jgi:hypothetical protein
VVGQKRQLSAVSGEDREDDRSQPPARKHAGSGPNDTPLPTKQPGSCPAWFESALCVQEPSHSYMCIPDNEPVVRLIVRCVQAPSE